MKCSKCNENEATIYIKKNINGVVTEKKLCANCAKEVDLKEIKRVEKIMDRCMKDMLMPVSLNSSFNNPFSFCDDIFELNDSFNFENDMDEKLLEENIKEEKTRDKEEIIKELQEKLNKAIKQERYEDAALLRDKINEYKE